MKVIAISAALSCAALYLVAASGGFTDPVLTVHEWGTFTSVAAPDGLPAEWNTLGCKDDLPGFVNDTGWRHAKFRIGGTVRMETPVMYFYSPREIEARVKVSFPHGLITEWYPRAEQRMVQENPAVFDTRLLSQTDVLQWKSVKVRPGADPGYPVQGAFSRYYAARATDAAPLSVGDQREKFLFYRGVARIPVSLSAVVERDGRIALKNNGAEPVPSVILFESHNGVTRYRNVGDVPGEIILDRPETGGSSAQVKTDLLQALIAHGLYPREATAMIDTWRDSWFEEGARLIYIVPEKRVNAMLPLEIEPTPASVRRVFVGRIELITPETTHAVQDALTKGDLRTLALYQRFLEPIGKAIGQAVTLPCATTE